MEITPEAIKRLREELDLSQREMAERVGVAKPTYQQWEWGGYRPRAVHRRKLRQIAKELEKEGVTK